LAFIHDVFKIEPAKLDIFQESDPQGRFIVIENEHRAREETMNDWMLKRKCDGKYEVTFKFPADFMLKPRQRVTVRSRLVQ
jgi:intermediate filament protein if